MNWDLIWQIPVALFVLWFCIVMIGLIGKTPGTFGDALEQRSALNKALKELENEKDSDA